MVRQCCEGLLAPIEYSSYTENSLSMANTFLSTLTSPSISHIDRLVFTKHMSTMVKAGIPLSEIIATLIDQSSSPALSKAMKKVLIDIENGSSLAKSLKRYPRMFDSFYVSLIEVGETSGQLERNLEFLAVHLGKDYQLRKKIQGALLYPGIVFSMAFAMSIFIGLFLLPQLVEFFDAFEIELPLTTKILLTTAVFMRDYGVAAILGFVVSMVALVFMLQAPLVKPLWHRVVLRTPIFGKLLRYNQLARFSRNLGMLMQSGVPIATALDTTSKTLSNIMFQQHLVDARKALTKGTMVGAALEKHGKGEFPPLVTKMVSVGEKTGNLENTLIYLGDFFEDEIDNITKNLTTTLEPVLLLGIGLIVGFVALAIITPIYDLTGSIRR